jgi:hypothetical protein
MEPVEAAAPRVVYADADHAIVIVGHCLVSYSRAEPSRAFLDDWIARTKELTAGDGRFVALVIVDSDADPPSDKVRVEINEVLRSLRESLVAIGYVFEGKGFVVAAKRSAVTMIALLARFSFPLRAFADVVAAAGWLSGELGGAECSRRARS